MVAVSWWAAIETRNISREVSKQVAYQAAQRARSAPEADGGGASLTSQEVAALEQTLQKQQTLLDVRRSARDTLRRGMVGDKAGPSALMRMIAASTPSQVWVTEIRVGGSRIDIAGKTLDPLAINVWLDHLRSSGYLAEKPVATVRLERFDPPASTSVRVISVYSYTLSATLSSPFAEDGGRP
ncbi:MAG: PilN domain-containing protein [Pseudomonadota bacterium]